MADKARPSNRRRARVDPSDVRRAADERRWSAAEESLVGPNPLLLHSGRNIQASEYIGATLLATSCVVIIPTLVVVAFFVGLLGASLLLTTVVGALASGLVIGVGTKIWKKDHRSELIGFGDLMLWSWAKHYYVERKIRRSSSALEIGKGTPRQRLRFLHDLNSALEHKDPETLGHSRRVRRYCCRMAEAMALPTRELAVLARAAELHDVGKVVIPDHILRKPDRLNPGERLIIQAHAEAGAELVEALGDATLTEAVLHHHERWDGHGYPEGLSGTRIPLLSRVIAVADTFDAITSARPYRERRSRAEAVQVLIEESGRQFDPLVVEGFVSAMESTVSSFLLLPFISTPRRYLERAFSWIKETGLESMAPAAAASGAAIIVAGSLIGGSVAQVDSQRKTPAPLSREDPSSATVPDFPHDLNPRFAPETVVLGRRIRVQTRPPSKRASSKEKQAKRNGEESKPAKKRSSSGAAGSLHDERPPRAGHAVTVPKDPQPSRGQDCTMPPASRGQELHCRS